MEENSQSTGVGTTVVTGADTIESADFSLPENDARGAEADCQAEVADLRQQQADVHERLLRMQAEFDNFRKRSERERQEYAEFAGEMTLRTLLPILDDFERALRAGAGAENELVRGIELIYGRMLEALKKQGLEPIEAAGAQFDPHQHEAIGRVESADHQEGTVVQEYQKGYRFRGRLLRPSMVQVAVRL